jgi:predicted ATPase
MMPREAALLSDGTLRALAVAAALLSVQEGSLVVIEEIDNGVHPSRAQMLLVNIQEIARDRQLRVLLTTHNPALLDAIPSDAVPDIVACYRDPEQGDSRLVRLEDLESYPELVAQGPLGRLVTKGILDRFLKDPDKRDAGTKTEKGLAWLSDFRRRAQAP